jgi:Family of unknown function (DUF6364)
MAKTNITLKIDRQLLKRIKVLAAQQDTSISALMTALLEQLVSKGKDLEYEQAKRRALNRIHHARALHWNKPESRAELYER